MKNIAAIFVLIIIGILCSITSSYAQSYSINGDLGIDTIPTHKLDVNGDGRFKGELLLDDNLRIPVLASNDSLIEKLVYIDENGRMQRLGEGGARDFEEYIHTLPCKYVPGMPEPVVYWNSAPGKIYAYSEECNFAPDVGIGTANPEARLHVRGSSYFTDKVGIGILNESTSKFQVRTIASSKAFEVLHNTVVDGTLVDKPVFHVRGDGTTKWHNIPTTANALSLRNEDDPDTDVFSLFGNGGIRLIMDRSEDTRALWVRNEDEEVAFHLKSNGQMMLQGMGVDSDALTIRGEIDGENGINIKGNGRIEQYVSEINSNRAFQLRNLSLTGDQELFNVRNNGRIQLKYIGDNDGLEVFRIERGNAPIIDGNSHIFSIRAYGRTQINFTGEGTQTAFGIKNGADSSSDYLFHVKGDGHISAAAVHVRELGNFPDYVFEPGYKLMPLEKLRKYIADNQRLPNMPAAEEVERNGVDLGEMNRLLVEKVEELTLYVLELEERLKAVEGK